MTIHQLLPSLFASVLAAAFSACAIWAIRPLLMRYTLVKPNARSSHRIPTPQGAGIAVIAATLAVAGGVIAYVGSSDPKLPTVVFGATLFIALVGAADDIKSIPVLPRLILQAAAVGAIVFTTPHDLRIISALPLSIERGFLLLAGLWFVNLVNFMDGLDWMTVAEVVPITGALVLLGALGALPRPETIFAAALGGATIGFAPFNRPIAKVFLGDVGSLAIGLLLGWCLLALAFHQHITAALLLPLYYLADATVTLLRRLTKCDPVWAAHRSHFYQRATVNGFTVLGVVGQVFVLNIALAALAVASTSLDSVLANGLALLTGTILVALALYRFSQKRPL